DDGRGVSFDLKDYNRIDHGYAATIHKAQGMTVDRTHVLATPGLDAHGSYVALSRHRDGMDLHYGRDDFADENRLVRTLSRDRTKDMASDYERADPAQDYAERRGIAFRERVERVVEIVSQAPEKVRGIFDGLRLSADGGSRPERELVERKVADDPEAALRRARTKALVRHARAVDAIFEVQEQGGRASPEQVEELQDARKVFEEVRPHGWRDAEAAYVKDPELAQEAATGRVNRAVRALQRETELRSDPQRRADRFVEHWQKLDHTSQHQYQTGNMSGYKATRAAMGDMAKSLARDPQLESILENRKSALGIEMETGRRLGQELAFNHGIDIGRGRSIGF
ncbi:MAG: Ti-type conjugative transfer relaxase TraA, partial [Alphaproteobacteria bacterium]|nr:Ti-type conjugative transfer relaxase TraA [Alphaproteobacteria bacterium]